MSLKYSDVKGSQKVNLADDLRIELMSLGKEYAALFVLTHYGPCIAIPDPSPLGADPHDDLSCMLSKCEIIGFSIGFYRNFGIGIGLYLGIGYFQSFRYRSSFRRPPLQNFGY